MRGWALTGERGRGKGKGGGREREEGERFDSFMQKIYICDMKVILDIDTSYLEKFQSMADESRRSRKNFMENVLIKYIDGDEFTPKAITDLTKPNREVKAFEQPKTNYDVKIPPKPLTEVLDSAATLEYEIKASKTKEELDRVMKKVKSSLLKWNIKAQLEEIAKKHFADNFYAD